MSIDESEALNPLQIFLLVLVEKGITSPYELWAKAGLGPGLTSSVLRRMQEEGLLTSTSGPRNRQRYALTETGLNLLQRSLQPGQTNYWSHGQMDVFDSLPRGLVLAWLHSGIEEAQRGADRAKEDLKIMARKKARNADDFRDILHRAQPGIVNGDTNTDEGVLVATAYQWLKAELQAAKFQLQAEIIDRVATLLAELPHPPGVRRA